MRLPIPIRLRLALVSAALAAAVLAAGLLTVYLIEAHQVHQTLVADARAAAHDLALAGEHTGATRNGEVAEVAHPARHADEEAPQSSAGRVVDGRDRPAGRDRLERLRPDAAGRRGRRRPPPAAVRAATAAGAGGAARAAAAAARAATRWPAPGRPRQRRLPDPGRARVARPAAEADDATEIEALKTYLGARSGSDQLLLYLPPHGRTLGNSHLATRLAGLGGPIPGSVRTVTLDGDGYVVATAARGSGIVMAGLPVAEADAAVGRLLDAMLIVGLIGLVPATALAWLIARRALSPLSRIAQRASRVTAGDLSVRMGPVTTRDEIGEVATAIDAMLDRLEIAFAAQRQFVHDASHELRTPLTIARGHLEVALPGRGRLARAAPGGRRRDRRARPDGPARGQPAAPGPGGGAGAQRPHGGRRLGPGPDHRRPLPGAG